MAESPDGRGVMLFGGTGYYENGGSSYYEEIRGKIILELRAGDNLWNILDITLENERALHVVIPLLQ